MLLEFFYIEFILHYPYYTVSIWTLVSRYLYNNATVRYQEKKKTSVMKYPDLQEVFLPDKNPGPKLFQAALSYLEKCYEHF